MEPLFSPWRSIWHSSDNVKPLLDKLDVLTTERSKGNQILPAIPPKLDRAELREAFNAMLKAQENNSVLSLKQISLWKVVIGPVLEIERWGRWLHLEQALEVASYSGDLAFSALLLRSMGEEMLRLLVLEYPNDSEYLQFKNSDSALKAWVAGALIAIEPLVQSHESAIAAHTPRYFSIALGEKASSSLKTANKSLNDYVHPNFGSHVLVCFPEESNGVTAILGAAISIYSAFLALPWARNPSQVPGIPMPQRYLAQMSKLRWRIEQRVLRKIQDGRPDLESKDKLDAPYFLQWLSQPNGLSQTESEAWVDADLLSNLDPLLPVPIDSESRNTTAELIESIDHFEFPLRFRSLSILQSWSSARRADEFLTIQRSTSNGLIEVGTAEWLRFNAGALHLAISTSLLKLDLLIGQTAFQVASTNPLGAVFCARSILEVLASIDWLVGRLESSWDEIVRQVSQGSFTTVELEKIDRDLAVFLTGSKGSLEQHRDWGESWTVSGKSSLGILEIVNKSFAELNMRRVYDATSAMVHGRLMRGVEILSTEISSKNYLMNLWRGISVADWACNDDAQIYLRSRAVRMSLRLGSLETAIGLDASAPDVLERATLSMNSLQFDKHFSGTGSKDDPVKFVDAIPYYEALNRYCSQFGIDMSKRRLEKAGGVFLDALQDGDSFIYFVPPQTFQD